MTNRLKGFKYKSSPAAPACIWGSGHTRETDPIKGGWRCRVMPGGRPGTYLIGQEGKAGCATIRPWKGGEWDVAIYLEAPDEVRHSFFRGHCDARFVQVADVPGFGLEIIREIEAERRFL